MISALVKDYDIYYYELQDLVWRRTGEVASVAAIAAACKRCGFTSKVASTVSLHRNRDAMREHAKLRSLFHVRQLLFVDEAHKAGRDLGRRYAKSRKGEKAWVPLSEHLGRAWTLLAAMDVTGLVAVKVQELSCKAGSYLPRALNRALWLQLFQERILPLLQPFDGRRLPRSVVVIDNASLHWGNDEDDEDEALVFVNQLDELIRSQVSINPATGQRVHPILCYTPPYCSRANAIEAMFKCMNSYIKAHAHGISKTDPKQAIKNGLLSVSADTAHTLVVQSCLDVESWL